MELPTDHDADSELGADQELDADQVELGASLEYVLLDDQSSQDEVDDGAASELDLS